MSHFASQSGSLSNFDSDMNYGWKAKSAIAAAELIRGA
jgi:hypothetical protein